VRLRRELQQELVLLAGEVDTLAVEIMAPEPGLEAGARFLVLGDGLRVGEAGFYFCSERTGTLNTVTRPRQTNRDPLPADATRITD
jgi:hypothetical protein